MKAEDPCCTGINGSHTLRCNRYDGLPINADARQTCWCCGGTFPIHWACLWSDKGSRCFGCEEDTEPCRAKVGVALESEP